MTVPQVRVDGTVVTNVFDVSYERGKDESIGSATVTVANTPTNRALFAPASDVDITPAGETDPVWSGEVIGSPSNTQTRNLKLEVEAETKAAQLEYAQVSRPFIERTNAEIIDKAVQFERDRSVGDERIFDGTAVDDVTTNADNVEPLTADGVSRSPTGDPDSLYVDFADGRSGPFDVTIDVPAAVPGRRLDTITIRSLFASAGGYFRGFFIFVDDGGIAYKWSTDITGGEGFETTKYPVEDAAVSSNASDFEYSNDDDFGDFDTSYDPPALTPNTFRIAADTSGAIPETRAFAIDTVDALPFAVVERGLGVTTDVRETEFVSTRRVNGSVLEVAREFAEEDSRSVYVTEDDVLQYGTVEDAQAPFTIEEDDPDIAIIDASFDRDFDVRNRVTIQGRGDLQVTFEDSGSIAYYNREVAKPEPIVDPSIRTREQAQRRARGFLRDEAWEDGSISFTSASPVFADARPGQILPIDWPSEDVSGQFIIYSTGRDESGYYNLSVSGTVSL